MSYFTVDKGIYQQSVRFVKRYLLQINNFINTVKIRILFNYNPYIMSNNNKNSNGPKTDEGKAISSRNSTTQGPTAKRGLYRS
jgi:hypothetical protein